MSTQGCAGCPHKDAACQHKAVQVVNTRLSTQRCPTCQHKAVNTRIQPVNTRLHRLSTQGCQHKGAQLVNPTMQLVNTKMQLVNTKMHRLSTQGCTGCQHRMLAVNISAGCQHKASGVAAISKFPTLCATSQRPPPSTSSTSAKIFP